MPRRMIELIVLVCGLLFLWTNTGLGIELPAGVVPAGTGYGGSEPTPEQPDSMHNPPPSANSPGQDSLVLEPLMYQPGLDTLLFRAYQTTDSITAIRRSPTLTMFKSVILPGWGQLANGKYIKAGLIIVVESHFLYKSIDLARKASDWRDKWKAAPADQKTIYYNQYADYRDSRNTYLWYTALTIFLSMFDAYVDAHLENFPDEVPTSEATAVLLVPGEETRLMLHYRF